MKAQLKMFEFRLTAIVISLEIFRENILQLLQIYVNLGWFFYKLDLDQMKNKLLDSQRP